MSGTGSINYSGTTTNIQQDSANLVVNWQAFNIQSGEQVNFNQPSSSAIALNRDFSGVASEIFGDLNANGQVYLFNTAGVLIGSGANVNVAGLFASDMTVSDAAFDNFTQNGTMTLSDSDNQKGGIVVDGAITTTTRNGITLIAQFIDNSGNMTASNGNVNLAIADGPIVVTDVNGTIGVQISEGITRDISGTQTLLNNDGDIRANNGDIAINIQYLSNLNVQAVRNTGLINAVGIGYGHITQNVVLQAPPAVITPTSPIEDVLSNSLAVEVDLANENDIAEAPSDGLTALDKLMMDCQPSGQNDKECIKKLALKRYLGRLLIGGNLPE